MTITAVSGRRVLPVTIDRGAARAFGNGATHDEASTRIRPARMEILSGTVAMTILADGTTEKTSWSAGTGIDAGAATTRQARAYLSAANDPPPALGSLFDLAA